MSRYLERAENQARFIEVTSNIALGYRGSELDLWSSLLHAGGDVENFKETYSAATQENVIRYLLFDPKNLNSVVSCLAGARENARSIFENLTTPMWEAVNRFYLLMRKAASESNHSIRQPHGVLEQIKCITPCAWHHVHGLHHVHGTGYYASLRCFLPINL